MAVEKGMRKDFDRWNEKKKRLHTDAEHRLYHEREVWWCALGANVGFEQDGAGDEYRRPALILTGISKQTCVIIPLTAATNPHPLRPSLGLVGGREARALLSQMRVIDTKRLVRKMEYLNKEIFERIRKAAKDML